MPSIPKHIANEKIFLDQYSPTDYDQPSLTVDIVLLTVIHNMLHTLLVRRNEHPAKDAWSLPGGFVQMTESLDQAANRIISEKAGLSDIFVEQLYTFGAIDRDPRGRIVSVAHYAPVDSEKLIAAIPADDATRCLAQVHTPWEDESGASVTTHDETGTRLSLAFDHEAILGVAIGRLRGKLNYSPIGFQLLPDTFTLRQLQQIHETILGHTVNKDAFRRRMLATGLVSSTGNREDQVGHRPAELYRFTSPSAV
ncbi:NUDIX hydrolase [bacterium]|nr:MAG: NUDIX hydrolase [bacterium]